MLPLPKRSKKVKNLYFTLVGHNSHHYFDKQTWFYTPHSIIYKWSFSQVLKATQSHTERGIEFETRIWGLPGNRTWDLLVSWPTWEGVTNTFFLNNTKYSCSCLNLMHIILLLHDNYMYRHLNTPEIILEIKHMELKLF